MTPKTILLVEDNPSDIALTRRALEKSRVANPMHVVEDGQEALDYLFCEGAYANRDKDELPALILLDLQLPKIGGLTVLERVRSDHRTRRVPIVVLTSSNEEQDLATSYDKGVNSYIRKPVSFDQFVSAISQLGVYWLILNEQPPKVPRE
jgi:two-component system response regulator